MSRNSPLISVIIPTHQRAELLRRALPTALAQSVSDLEVIVVENGQSHEGKTVVEEFQRHDDRVRYLYQPEPNLPIARNAGVQASRGRYVAFLDDDDEWLPMKLERQLAVAESDSTVGLVTCKAWLVDDEGTIIGTRPQFDGSLSFRALLTDWCCICSPSSVLIRRSCFDRIGFFDPNYQAANDYDWYLRLSRAFRMVMIHEPLIRYQRHEGNMSNNRRKIAEETIQVLEQLPPEPDLGVTRGMIFREIAKFFHALAVDSFDAQRWRAAAGEYVQAIRHDPCVGVRIPWGRFTNPGYRLLRPYLCALYCGLISLRA